MGVFLHRLVEESVVEAGVVDGGLEGSLEGCQEVVAGERLVTVFGDASVDELGQRGEGAWVFPELGPQADLPDDLPGEAGDLVGLELAESGVGFVGGGVGFTADRSALGVVHAEEG